MVSLNLISIAAGTGSKTMWNHSASRERMLTRSLNLSFSSGLTTTSHPGPQEVMAFDGSAHACAVPQLGYCSVHTYTYT